MKIVRKVNISQDYYSKDNFSKFFELKVLKTSISRESLNIDLLNAAIFHYTNIERNKFKIPICEFHPILRDTSIIHSAQMKMHDFFNHENPYNPTYRTLNDRVNSIKTEQNRGFSCIGENISDYPILKTDGNKFVVKSLLNNQRYYSIDGLKEIHPFTYDEFAREVVNGWMNSQGHRQNILNPQFKYLGCGAVMYEKKNNSISVPMLQFKITQNFGGDLLRGFRMKNTDKKIRIIKK
ncbi:MAG: CAP domain-containing protein [Draconibacterium sp.]|nr:CAP domain-containing protein [Draconibacterium sp.]